ncbi:hypothetical protein EUGRSUZ_F00402 [Eucalyptus grandis]|uniref:Uncharacterized protein n=2 Tax=Eucalyptus grandis TaxID=71139 RepID=A0ACC3KBS5_EUCGR|nr:hypothetical protein EUGRSUZ_F00402 [Eucalyptus grandis]
MDRAKDVLRKKGPKAAEAAKKAEDLARHMATFIADVAIGRIAQGTKVLAEGGRDKIFRHTFETIPEEKLLKSYPCYLSTSAGPVMGVTYLSMAKLVVIQRHQLKAVVPSTSTVKPTEKYIQVISIDNHEFWFMGFLHYESAVKNLQGAVPTPAPP